ncbi:MAG: shikimate kinase, partial [Acidobacteriota bacterium]
DAHEPHQEYMALETRARRVRSRFFDLDQDVEAAAGMPISRLFQSYGKTYFRVLEHVCLRRTRERPPAIIATGGGAFTFERNINFIKNLGISLWIDVDFDSIVGRMSERGRAARPLLHDEERARALFTARRNFYRRADLVVEATPGEAADSVAAEILGLLREKHCVTS